MVHYKSNLQCFTIVPKIGHDGTNPKEKKGNIKLVTGITPSLSDIRSKNKYFCRLNSHDRCSGFAICWIM